MLLLSEVTSNWERCFIKYRFKWGNAQFERKSDLCLKSLSCQSQDTEHRPSGVLGLESSTALSALALCHNSSTGQGWIAGQVPKSMRGIVQRSRGHTSENGNSGRSFYILHPSATTISSVRGKKKTTGSEMCYCNTLTIFTFPDFVIESPL